MKKITFFLTFTFLCVYSYSQNLDLIVYTKGDSLACHIDSITDSHIYFKMRFNHEWIHIYESLNYIVNYQYDVINKKTTKFKPGTSYIKPYNEINKDFDIGNNTIYLEMDVLFLTTINYERRFPLTDRHDLALSIGYGNAFSGKLLFLMGGPYQYFEIGAVALSPMDDGTFYGVLLGYRFQGKNELQIRGPVMFFYEDDGFILPFTGFSFGFSF